MHAGFQAPLSCLRMGFETETLPYQGIKTPTTCVFITLCGSIMFQASWILIYAYLKHVHHVAPSQPHCYLSLPRGGAGPSHYSIKGCRPVALHQPSGKTLATADWCPLLKLVFLCLFCLWRKYCSSNVWLCCVFLGNSDTKMQWAEVFGLLFQVVSIVLIFAVFHVAGILLWHW